jgi:hypothetical protein
MADSSLSVIVVSDYETGHEKTWHTERLVLEGLARQDIQEPFEVLLVENQRFQDTLPADLNEILPGLRVLFTDEERSARRKNYGVGRVSGDLVAVLEADSIPSPAWLRILVGVLRSHPEVSAASGRTTYGNRGTVERTLSLLDRGFDDLGHSGFTVHISNNGAVYRRSFLEAFPYPEAVTPFVSARMRLRQMRDAGHRVFFEPEALMHHAIGGWNFVRDFRRNTGYADMMGHQHMRYRMIPYVLWQRLREEWSDCRRVGPRYLRCYDWPLALALLAILRPLEIPGMVAAIQGRKKLPKTAYR